MKFINQEKFWKSFLAIICGFIITGIILAIAGINPFVIFQKILISPFSSSTLFTRSLMLGLIFVIVAIASSFSFKGMVFNIGISGQMLAGANITSVIALTFFDKGLPFGWILMIILGIGAGAFMGFVAGLLKAKFNIHEVLSTIMLNWIIFFIGKFTFSLPHLRSTTVPGSRFLHSSFNIPLGAIIFLTITVVAFMIFIFSKTILGYQIEMVGKNKHAAHYAGISHQNVTITTLAISGGIAGLAGVIYYSTYIGNYYIPLFDRLNPIGFNAITISLIAFKNPLAVLILGVFFGFINIGGQVVASVISVSGEIMSLLMGIILYLIAISILLNLFYEKYWQKPKRGEK